MYKVSFLFLLLNLFLSLCLFQGVMHFADPLQPWSSGKLISTFHNFLQQQSSGIIPYTAQDCLSTRIDGLVPSVRLSPLLSTSVISVFSPFLPTFTSSIALRSMNFPRVLFLTVGWGWRGARLGWRQWRGGCWGWRGLLETVTIRLLGARVARREPGLDTVTMRLLGARVARREPGLETVTMRLLGV